MRIVREFLKESTEKKKYLIKLFIRMILVLVCFLICLIIPNFISFISFVGSFLFPIAGVYVPVI